MCDLDYKNGEIPTFGQPDDDDLSLELLSGNGQMVVGRAIVDVDGFT